MHSEIVIKDLKAMNFINLRYYVVSLNTSTSSFWNIKMATRNEGLYCLIMDYFVLWLIIPLPDMSASKCNYSKMNFL